MDLKGSSVSRIQLPTTVPPDLLYHLLFLGHDSPTVLASHLGWIPMAMNGLWVNSLHIQLFTSGYSLSAAFKRGALQLTHG